MNISKLLAQKTQVFVNNLQLYLNYTIWKQASGCIILIVIQPQMSCKVVCVAICTLLLESKWQYYTLFIMQINRSTPKSALLLFWLSNFASKGERLEMVLTREPTLTWYVDEFGDFALFRFRAAWQITDLCCALGMLRNNAPVEQTIVSEEPSCP